MLSEYLYQLTNKAMFQDRLFRGGTAGVLAALLVFILMPKFIKFMQKIDATADFSAQKKPSTPIMGGIILVFSVMLTTFCFSALNGYTISALVILLAYSCVGAIDDVMKVRNKKLVAQGKLSKADYQNKADGVSARVRLFLYVLFSLIVAFFAYKFIPELTGHLTVPFIKPSTWYPRLPSWAFILVMTLVISATANGANFTDGLDSLVAVPLITTSVFAGLVAYVSGNAVFSSYLHIPFLPGVDELMPICAAIAGANLAYLWFNSPPAQIYMGDTGSIGFGGIIGMIFILIKAELFLPIVGIIFLAEGTSVVLQMGGFKITRKFSNNKEGRRIFLRAPLHHHFQLKYKDLFENAYQLNSKIIWRFHIISIMAMIIGAILFFKIR